MFLVRALACQGHGAVGYVPLSQTGAELLFEVISQRYERGSTLVTPNLCSDALPRWLAIAPLLWALIGSSAAVLIGVPEDLGLLTAGIAAAVILAMPRRTVTE